MTQSVKSLKRCKAGPAVAAIKICDENRLKLAANLHVPVVCADFNLLTSSWPRRRGQSHFQFAIGYGKHKNIDLLLDEVEKAMACGASSVYCVSSPEVVQKLANRGIPVFAHTGLVPQICTGAGGLRAIGKEPIEAERIRDAVRRFADAGAQGVYLQLVPADLATDVTRATDLVTVSVGSGGGCDIVWAHAEDILGENADYVPRHAKVYATSADSDDDICFRQYLGDVQSGRYPGPEHYVATS